MRSRQNKRRVPFNPTKPANLEPLEGRVLLSAVLEAGLLTIEGSDANDVIEIAATDIAGQVIINKAPGAEKGDVFDGVTGIAIDSFAGNDKIKLRGLFTDTLGDPTSISISAGEGNNKITGSAGDDVITVGDGKNKITDASGNNTIETGDGRNTIKTGAGDDVITTGDESDKIQDAGGNNTIDAGDGKNNIRVGDGDNTITTGVDNDNIRAGDGHHQITSVDGKDNIRTGHSIGDSVIDAGEGQNKVRVGDGAFTILGGDDRNTIRTGAGNHIITTGAGADNIRTGDGDNTIDAGEGRNNIRLGDGVMDIITGDGNDNIRAGDGGGEIDAGGGRNNIRVGDGVIDIITGAGDDNIKAGDGDNTIDAGDGKNKVTVGDGSNTITTGAGADTIKAGDGGNTIDSGAGRDKVSTGVGDDDIDGGDGDDSLQSKGGENTLRGGGGNDKIKGGKGNDVIEGGDGDDNLRGGDGDDDIEGNDGEDKIDGGKGANQLRGGKGFNQIRSRADDNLGDEGDGIYTEHESNNTLDTADRFELSFDQPIQISGSLSLGDIDYFIFRPKSAGHLKIESDSPGNLVLGAILYEIDKKSGEAEDVYYGTIRNGAHGSDYTGEPNSLKLLPSKYYAIRLGYTLEDPGEYAYKLNITFNRPRKINQSLVISPDLFSPRFPSYPGGSSSTTATGIRNTSSGSLELSSDLVFGFEPSAAILTLNADAPYNFNGGALIIGRSRNNLVFSGFETGQQNSDFGSTLWINRGDLVMNADASNYLITNTEPVTLDITDSGASQSGGLSISVDGIESEASVINLASQ